MFLAPRSESKSCVRESSLSSQDTALCSFESGKGFQNNFLDKWEAKISFYKSNVKNPLPCVNSFPLKVPIQTFAFLLSTDNSYTMARCAISLSLFEKQAKKTISS